MVMKPTVNIEGMAALQRSLRQIGGKELARELRDVNMRVADLVADVARAQVPSKTGAARSTLKPKGEGRYAVIKAGGRKAPYYPWLDFGGRVGRNRSVQRPFRSEGRYIYPTVGRYRSKIINEYVTELDKLMDRAGL